MTREEAKELLPIIQAYAEGKHIQWRNHCKIWIDVDERDGLNTEFPLSVYRIKPEPEYRPFKTKEECWNEMHCHSDFGWLIRIETGIVVNISAVHLHGILFDQDLEYTYQKAFKYYKFTDGTPFGSKLPTNI